MDRLKQRIYSLLRHSERYTKTDMVYLFSGGFWITLSHGVSAVASFLLAVAFANFLPQETYGTYKYVLTIAGLFAIFTLPGMGTAISRAVAQGNEGSIHAATRQRVLWSLIGSACAFLGAGYYHFVGDNQLLAIALVIIGCTLPLFDTFTLFDSYLAGRREFARQTKYHLLIQVISIPILIATAFFTKNLLAILLAYFLPVLILRFVLYYAVLRHIRRDAPADEETISYGKHLTAISILSTLSASIDKILLWKFLGPAQLAIYTFALAVPEQLKGPMRGVADLALPKFAAQTEAQIRENLGSFKRKLFIYAGFLLLLSVLYAIAAPYIYALLFPQYLESVLYSQIFMFSAFALVGTLPLSVLSAHKKTKEQYQLNTIQPILQCLAFIVLIPTLGILGAILARVILRLFYVTYTYRLMVRALSSET